MTRRVLPALVLLLAGQAGAQLRELQPGARVRVTAPTVLGGKLEGMIIGRRGDTVSIVSHNAAPVDIPISALSRVEISRGKSRAAGAKKGFLWGVAIGFPVGLATATGDNKTWNLVDENCDPFFQTCGTHSDVEQVMLVSVGSGAIAAGIGTLIGRERWETLNLPLLPVVIVKRHGVVIGTRIGLAF
jgi:hypothetical protein